MRRKILGILMIACGLVLYADSFSGGGGGSTGGGLGPMNPTVVTPPVLANWTFDNGGGNGTTANTTGGVLINSVSGNQLKVLYVAAPTPSGTAFTLQAGLSGSCVSATPDFGIVVGDTGAKYEVLNYTSGDQLTVADWTNSSTFGGVNPFATTAAQLNPFLIWFKIKYDGTNLIFYYSPTGADANSYIQLLSHVATTFLATAPAKIGFEAHSQNTGFPCIVTLWHWNVTTP